MRLRSRFVILIKAHHLFTRHCLGHCNRKELMLQWRTVDILLLRHYMIDMLVIYCVLEVPGF